MVVLVLLILADGFIRRRHLLDIVLNLPKVVADVIAVTTVAPWCDIRQELGLCSLSFYCLLLLQHASIVDCI